jgi:hypothetical protein
MSRLGEDNPFDSADSLPGIEDVCGILLDEVVPQLQAESWLHENTLNEDDLPPRLHFSSAEGMRFLRACMYM